MSGIQKLKNWFFQFTNTRRTDGTMGGIRFRTNDKPNQATFENLLASIPFHLEPSSKATLLQQGLIKLASDAAVKSFTPPDVNYSYAPTVAQLALLFAGFNYRYIAVVDPDGNDTTGTIGISRPFATVTAANAALTTASVPDYLGLVIINPGNYTVAANPFRYRTNYYFHKGSKFTNSSGSIVSGKFDSSIYGFGIFVSNTAPVFIFNSASDYAKGCVEFSYITRQDSGRVVEANDGGDIDIVFRGMGSKEIGSNTMGQIQAPDGNTIYLVSTNNTKDFKCRFQNCFISNATNGSTMFGNILGTADSFVLIKNCIIAQEDDAMISNTIQFQAGSIPLAIYDTKIKTSTAATYSTVVPTLYYDNNVLANMPTNNTSDIGPGTTIQVDATYDKIFQ